MLLFLTLVTLIGSNGLCFSVETFTLQVAFVRPTLVLIRLSDFDINLSTCLLLEVI